MRYRLTCLFAFGLSGMLTTPAFGAVIYNNLTPNNAMAIPSRPQSTGAFEIEAADDFFLGSQTAINSATFVGLILPGPAGTPSISEVLTEMYRVFPRDSNTN